MTKLARALAYAFLTVALLTPMALAAEAVPAADGLDDPPARDAPLEERLKVEQTYKTKQGDTLSRISRLLYGHASWWRRIRKFNGDLMRGMGANDPIPRGTDIRYLAPEVGVDYVVQPNDWLIRIAAWKYGSTEKWEQLFATNAAVLSDPDLIRPGDRLTLSTDGTVRNRSTGKTVMTGDKPPLTREELVAQASRQAELLEKAQQRFAEDQARALADAREHAQMGDRGVAGFEKALEPDPWSWESPYFLAGFCTGVLILLLGPIAWMWSRATEAKFIAHANIESVADTGPLVEEEAQESLEPEMYRPPNDFDGFKKRPVEDPTFDRELVHFSDGEVDRRPGYHSLIPRRLRKYLNRRAK